MKNNEEIFIVIDALCNFEQSSLVESSHLVEEYFIVIEEYNVNKEGVGTGIRGRHLFVEQATNLEALLRKLNYKQTISKMTLVYIKETYTIA